MLSSLFSMALASLAVASSLGDHTVDKRQLGCVNLPTVTDTFDEAAVVPLLPEVASLLAPTPNGTYLNYTKMGYANYGPLTNVVVPSSPNAIFVSPETNNGTLIPTFNRANAFGLSSFRFACVTRSAETVAVLPATCTLTVSCNAWGLTGPATIRLSKSFSYKPSGLLTINFDTATFPPTFNFLSQCFITLDNGSPLGLGIVPPSVGKELTILAIDNVVNRGQVCPRI